MKVKELKNGNLNNVYLLSNNQKEYIIRESIFDNSFESNVLRLLNENTFNCPEIITNFKTDSKYIMICKYIIGENPKNIDKKHIIELGKMLNQLHSISYSFTTNDYKSNEETIEKMLFYFQNIKENKLIRNDISFLYKSLKEIKGIDLTLFPKSIVHSDIKKENMLINGNKVYLIDFGNCYIGCKFIDIIRVIMWLFVKENNINENNITYFLKSYAYIEKVEKDNFIILLKFCLLYNLFKDIYLYQQKLLPLTYIKNNTIIWLKLLKDDNKIHDLERVIKNA